MERGEKSISLDSLYPIAVALKVPLRDLADVREKPEGDDAEKILARIFGFRDHSAQTFGPQPA